MKTEGVSTSYRGGTRGLGSVQGGESIRLLDSRNAWMEQPQGIANPDIKAANVMLNRPQVLDPCVFFTNQAFPVLSALYGFGFSFNWNRFSFYGAR